MRANARAGRRGGIFTGGDAPGRRDPAPPWRERRWRGHPARRGRVHAARAGLLIAGAVREPPAFRMAARRLASSTTREAAGATPRGCPSPTRERSRLAFAGEAPRCRAFRFDVSPSFRDQSRRRRRMDPESGTGGRFIHRFFKGGDHGGAVPASENANPSGCAAEPAADGSRPPPSFSILRRKRQSPGSGADSSIPASFIRCSRSPRFNALFPWTGTEMRTGAPALA